MSNYTITTDFGAKDSLPSSNSAKVVRGSEFTTEFTNIQTAIATKADTAGDTFTGAVTFDAAVTLNSTATITGDLTVDTDTLFVDVSADKVGIGTTSPDNTLVVQGASTTGASSTGNVALFEGPSGTNGLKIFVDDTENAAGLQTILSDDLLLNPHGGNVGIGTSSPAELLHVTGASTAKIQITSTSATGISGLHFGDPDDVNVGRVQYEHATNHMALHTSDTERMRIDTSGNVLVGKTSDAFEVEGMSLRGSPTSNASVATFTRDSSNVAAFNRLTDNGSLVTFYKDGTTVGSIGSIAGGIEVTAPTYLVLGCDDTGIRIASNEYVLPYNPSTDALKDGTVSLGVASSRFKDLYLSGTGYFGTSVGIGTTSPATKLHIENGASANNIIQVYGGTSLYAGIGVDGNGAIFTAGSSGSLNAPMIFRTASNGTEAERMRLSQSGNVLVGKTAVEMAAVGVEVKPAGEVRITSDDVFGLQLNRKTGDGEIINLRKDGSTVGSIGTKGGEIYIAHDGTTDTGLRFRGNGTIIPVSSNGTGTDGAQDLGTSAYRFKDFYRSGSTFATSDRNKKQDIRDLTDAEARVATVAKGSLKAFRYIDSVEAEGDEANIHFGIIAQDLKAAFEAEGLNANDYQVLKTSTYTDDDGVEQTTYSICYENLLAFIIAAI